MTQQAAFGVVANGDGRGGSKDAVAEQGSIRIIKKKKGHGSHHGGAWKVAYADFVTAMMAFFLVMWIVGLSNNIKQAVAGYFKDPIAFMKAVKAGNAPFAAGVAQNGKPGPGKTQDKQTEIENLARTKQSIEKMVADSPEFASFKKYVDVKLTDEGLNIELMEAKESLFFDSGSAHVKPGTRKLLGKMAAEMNKLPNKVIIEGHTDSRPLARKDGYTNWELSADRANSARQVMEAAGLRKDQVVQVRGCAATQPRNPANPAHYSNRRVTILVVMDDALKRQQLGAKPDFEPRQIPH